MMPIILNNRYKILQNIGSGGFGETFLAQDIHMPSGRRCVIKQLKPMTNNPQLYQIVQERFQREAAILEELGNLNNQIPSLYGYLESAGQFYLVQEWIEGVTLTKKLEQQGALSESSVRDILIGILPVLDFVHSKRIIHRDIKPDNIILRQQDDKPILIDFGAVKETMGTVVNSQGNTTSSIVIGTPGFMPSEQAAGRPTYSSDLYSLGLTAIYLLTGKIPQELETDLRTGEIIWRQHVPRISPSFATLLDKVIMYHPRDRYATAREMLDALQSTTAPQPTPLLPAQDSGKNILLGSLITGGLISASIVVGLILTRTPQPSPEQSLTEQAASSPEATATPSATPKIVSVTPSVITTSVPTPSSMPVIASPEPQQPIKTPVSPVTPDFSQDSNLSSKNFYFVADSAFPNSNTATRQIKTLNTAGYGQAGMFWIPDYPNLSGKYLFQVYAAKFSDRKSCAKFLTAYSQRNSRAYCVFGSQKANLSPDRF